MAALTDGTNTYSPPAPAPSASGTFASIAKTFANTLAPFPGAAGAPAAAPQATTPDPTPTQKPSQTTLYSGNVQEKYVPDLTNRMKDISAKGQFTDGNGNLRYADGSLVPPPADATQSSGGNYFSGGKSYGAPDAPAGGSGNDLGIPPAEQALIDQMRASSDEATKGLIDSIHQTYAALKDQQRQINAGQEAGINTALLRAGSTRYSPESAGGQSAATASYGLRQIADLEAKENSAIAAAKAAQQTKNYELMDKQLTLAETVRKEKQAAAQKLSDQLLADKAQAEKDTAIAKLYSAGTTDPATMLAKLQEMGMTNVTAKDIGDSLKTLVPAGLDDLVKTMRANGASGELIAKVLQSPDMNAAYKAAGNYSAGGSGMVGEYNYAKANGYSGTFSQYQNEDANRKAKASGSLLDTITNPATDKSTVSAVGASKTGDILSVTGLSLPAFNFLTQGTAALTRLGAEDRFKIMGEAQSWLKDKGIDVSTFQSQYKSYNDVLAKNIARANQTQIMAGEVSGSADSLMKVIDESDLKKMTNVKAAIIADIAVGKQVNSPTAMKYATQIQFMANDLAGYLAAARGASGGPELADINDAARIISTGLSKGSTQAFKEAVTSNEEKVAGVVQHAVDSTRKQVWGLFGVADKYTSSPVAKTSDQILADDKAAVTSIATFVKADPAHQAIIDHLHQLMPDASAAEVAQQLGL